MLDAVIAVVNFSTHPRLVQLVTDMGKWYGQGVNVCDLEFILHGSQQENWHCPSIAQSLAQKVQCGSSQSHPVTAPSKVTVSLVISAVPRCNFSTAMMNALLNVVVGMMLSLPLINSLMTINS